jgi:signal transduction histidine kinase
MVQLNNVCHEVMRLVQREPITNGISVTVKCSQDLPQVWADFIQLQQVMLNVVRNAIDVMSQRPLDKRHLRLRSTFDGKSTVSVFIRDTGAGVPVESRERIFDAFYTTKSFGAGLGLAVSRTIIEEHGGTLRLIKTGPEGSTFQIALPVSVAASIMDSPAEPVVTGN